MLWHLIQNLLPLFPFLGLLWSPCCCASCTFFSDDFNRADNDNPGSYTEVSGDWDIASNVLSTASSSGVLVGTTANPNSDSNTQISVTVNIATSGDTARIILAYLNSSNYWFAEFKAGSGAYVKIYQRSGGSNTEKSTVSITRATGSFNICASIENGTRMVASVGGVGTSYYDTFTNTGYGLGTGTLTGTVTFDDLVVNEVSGDCPSTCTITTAICTDCDSSDAPYEVRMVLGSTGLANCTGGEGSCPGSPPGCTLLPGTYYGFFEPITGVPCRWRAPIPGTFCSISDWYLTLYHAAFQNSVSLFAPLANEFTPTITWTDSFADNDCSGWSDTNVPFLGNGTGCLCKGTSSTTMTITAL